MWVHPTPGKSTLITHLYKIHCEGTPYTRKVNIDNTLNLYKHIVWIHHTPGKSTLITYLYETHCVSIYSRKVNIDNTLVLYTHYVGTHYTRKVNINNCTKHIVWLHTTPGKSTLINTLVQKTLCGYTLHQVSQH